MSWAPRAAGNSKACQSCHSLAGAGCEERAADHAREVGGGKGDGGVGG